MIDILEKSLREAYPSLSDKDVARLITTLLEAIAERISNGEQIASIRELSDGSFDISVLHLGLENTAIYRPDEEELTGLHPRLIMQISAPFLMDASDFLEYAGEPIKAIDFIYVLLYFISINEYSQIRRLCEFINQNNEVINLERREFFQEFEKWSILPYKSVEGSLLQVISVHYGSPISFDLLGIGNILAAIRDLGKDAVWRANHERLIAKSERELKGTEIEKAKLEIANQKMALEKMGLEVALQRVEILERLHKLPLNKQEKIAIASVLVPRIIEIVDKNVSFSLIAEPFKKMDE